METRNDIELELIDIFKTNDINVVTLIELISDDELRRLYDLAIDGEFDNE